MAASIFWITQRLASLISNEADFLFGVKDQVQLLSNEVSLMSCALRDAGEKRRTSNEVKEWLNQVRDVVMEAEDLIYFFIFGAERRRHQNILTRYIISYPNLIYNLHKLAWRIEISNKKIKQLSDRRSTLGLATLDCTRQSSASMINKEQAGLPFLRGDRVEEFCVVGFEEEENEIVKKLLMHVRPPQSCPTVVSIVGMGGSGKTTLARKVYKRNDVKEHFQTCAWISVSQQYNLKDLLLVISEQIKPLTSMEKKEVDVESLTERLSSHLKETTYLIVFDDLWRPQDWHMLKRALPIQGEGYQSRVLVTTRNETVARHADPITHPHHKHLLNEYDSWELFVTTVMRSNYLGCPKDLEDLGRKIVHKCHGLPLAIVVLGGLLSIKPKTHIAWSKVLHCVSWELYNNQDTEGMSCKQVLSLSYTDLPDHLKPCFLYLGLFPEDSEILRHKLIWLWVAEGFIRPRDCSTMEDVAEEYMEELIQRNMIQATLRSYDGRVTCWRMHDLVRDLAIFEAKQERFLEILGSDHSISPNNKSCRISITEPTGGMYDSPITNALNQSSASIHLHSLLCFSTIIERNMWMKSSFYGTMKLLRVLDLESVSNIPSRSFKQIGKLILLRYLGLRYTNLKKLPSSIGDLQNLQTLDICYTRLRQLPTTIMKLKQLRNLIFVNTFEAVSQGFDCSLDHMTNLRTLVLHEGKWIEGRLERLTNLRDLRIYTYGGSLSQYKEVLLSSIPKLIHLRGICLVDRLTFQSNDKALIFPISFSNHLELNHMVISGIAGIRDFPPNLTTLYLCSQRGHGTEELMATLKKLPKLRCLMLSRACMGSKIIFSTDGFHHLEELVLIDLDDLQELVVEEGALPNLKILKIERCGLRRLPRGLKQVVSLQELIMSSMSKEFYYSVRKDAGEDWEIIKHIPTIETKPELPVFHWSLEMGHWS